MPSDFTPNNAWAENAATEAEHELTTPTGQTLRARKVSIESLLEMGILTMADSLTPMMDQHMKKTMSHGPSGPATEAVDVSSLMSDPTAIKSIVTLVDKVMPSCIVSPVVKLHYTEQTIGKTTVTKMIPADKREPGIIYTDQIPFEDKMWLFEWAAGGLQAMTSFREGSTADVGSVVPLAKPKGTPKRRSRAKG